jgi:palmitoyl transferase
LWERLKQKPALIMEEGQTSILLPFHTYHGHDTYPQSVIDSINENTWGFGLAKTRRNSRDNEEMLYAMGNSDSNFKPQFMAGYAYQWTLPIVPNFEVGAGITAFLMSRVDIFDNTPFPGALPMASVGTRSIKLIAAYVPKLPDTEALPLGDVTFLLMRLDLNFRNSQR